MQENVWSFAIDLIGRSHHLVVVTGAGVSTDSGIPPFRGPDGLWQQFDPDEYARLDTFVSNPAKSWRFFLFLLDILADASPNAAHTALANLERAGIVKHTITQNVDGLHQAAGQQKVIEIHGSMQNLVCMKCAQTYISKGMLFDTEDLPPVCSCGGVLKPDAVLFGEPISTERYFAALEQIRAADVLILAGTSGLVHPANEFPDIAVRHGARIIEINTERTLITRIHSTLFLEGSAGDILTRIHAELLNGSTSIVPSQ